MDPELMRLCETTKKLVVTVKKFYEPTGTLRFCTGFVVYSDANDSYICVNNWIVSDEDDIYVCFTDEHSQKAEVFLKDTTSNHAVLKVQNLSGQKPAVSFSRYAAELDQEVWLPTDVQQGYGFNLIPGKVCASNCSSKDKSGSHVAGTEYLFLMKCSSVSQVKKEGGSPDYVNQIIGSAVFDKEGSVVGMIDSLDNDPDGYDLKYTKHACYFVNGLEKSLKRKHDKISLTRTRPKIQQTYQRKKKKGNGQNFPGTDDNPDLAEPTAS